MLPFFDVNQHGFIRGKSTLSNGVIFTNFISECIDDGNEAHCVLTDFSKAFDTVDHDILIHKLKLYGIAGNLLDWFNCYLRNRPIRVSFLGSNSRVFIPGSGVPQGSILGPLLFNIFINDLGTLFKSQYLFYADDLKLFSRVRSIDDCHTLQNDLQALNNWCGINRLHLNISKCQVINFTLKRNPISFDYNLNDIILNVICENKDLGIIFENKLKFQSHIESIVNRGYRMLGYMTRISRFFTDIHCYKTLYYSLVRSHLEFSTPIWSPHQNFLIHHLERVQRKFSRMLIYRIRHPYCDYQTRLDFLQLPSLYSRRLYFDMCLLYNILHSSTFLQLRDLISFRNNDRPNRNNIIFNSLRSRTNYGLFVNIVSRLQRTYQTHFSNINLFNENYTQFKSAIKMAMNQIQTPQVLN